MKLFPELETIGMPITFTSIYMSKMYIYYYTKLEFLGYLGFLADIPIHVKKYTSTKTDLEVYKSLCDHFLDYLKKTIDTEKVINAKTYEKIVDYFENAMNNLINSSKFVHQFVYRNFFEHYSFYSQNSYGFILVNSNKDRYYTEDGHRELPEPISILAALEDAKRAYIFIDEDGEQKTYSLGKNEWEEYSNEIKSYYNTNIGNFRAYQRSDYQYYIGVGPEEIPKGAAIKIRGVPMFNSMPFDILEEFCNPRVFKN